MTLMNVNLFSKLTTLVNVNLFSKLTTLDPAIQLYMNGYRMAALKVNLQLNGSLGTF